LRSFTNAVFKKKMEGFTRTAGKSD
jgi:hypothetical protein